MKQTPSLAHSAQQAGQGPKVSVIMPLYNASAFVKMAIESIQAQTFTDWELVAVDDMSTDGTFDIVADMAKQDTRIRVIKQPRNGGPTAARNIAMEHAKGRFIAFLDGDDLWLPEKLHMQLKALEESPHAICCTNYAVICHDGLATGRVRHVKNKHYTLHNILTNNVIGCLTVLIDTHKTGPLKLSTDYKIAEDYALWVSILRQGHTAIGVPHTLAHYRLTRDSHSCRKINAALGVWKVFTHENWLPKWKAVWYFTGYAIRRAPRLWERM